MTGTNFIGVGLTASSYAVVDDLNMFACCVDENKAIPMKFKEKQCYLDDGILFSLKRSCF
jgi:hypothetical protein